MSDAGIIFSADGGLFSRAMFAFHWGDFAYEGRMGGF